ncbi:ABC transporter ATP-binding protein [Selenomonadales bacterium OttesenSCG-928-I06]|nr:ABC transporter ATP-binding protein [Selenomonadales bacterium OttesenSCG-928-I06]
MALLEVRNLSVTFDFLEGKVQAVRDVNFEIEKGEILGIVGESGCGKSVMAKSIMRLICDDYCNLAGNILFNDVDLLTMSEEHLQKIRGNFISMAFQNPLSSLNPVLTIGLQVAEPFLIHTDMSRKDAFLKAQEMISKVGISDPETRLLQYPHQISGGMRQRVAIAMALALEPQILIADEVTTALDVTVQAQIIELLKKLNKELSSSIMFITHDLALLTNICHRVIVMYAGQIVESASVDELYNDPKHPYTKSLLQSIPRIDKKKKSLTSIPGSVIDLRDLPDGCAFFARCSFRKDVCKTSPELQQIGAKRFCRCHCL